MRARTISRIWCVLASGLTAVIACGCGTSDPSGYRRIEQVQTTSNESPPASEDAAKTPVLDSSTSDKLTTGRKPGPTVDPGSNVAIDETQPSLVPESVTDEAADEDLPVSALGPVNVIDGASVAMLLRVMPGEVEVASDPADNAVEPASAIAAIPSATATITASATPATTVAAKPRIVEVLIPEKSFQRDASSKALRVSYDDLDLLKVLNLEPVTENAVELMPAWLKDLNGQRVRLRGFMYPTFEAEGIERFVLARDNQICCFGRDPKIYDLVQVDMRQGKTTDYIPATRAFDVIGRFKIEMASEDGKPYGLYYIEDAEIIDR